jgi:hypothetical protein
VCGQIRLVGGVMGEAHPIGVGIEVTRVCGNAIVFLQPQDTGQAWPALSVTIGARPMMPDQRSWADWRVLPPVDMPMSAQLRNREETTGIAFHHDAPGARPPQAILLAVPPQAANPVWSVDAIVDTVVEAHDLARVRAVDPRHIAWLGTALPALYLPESLAKDVPAINLEDLVVKYDAVNAATDSILGKG